MKLKELFNEKKTVFSFEIFPPKRNDPVDTVFKTLDALKDLEPDFISVTYGAGGSLKDHITAAIASAIKNHYGLEAAAHLTCVNSTREDVDEALRQLYVLGVENILALRGDPVEGQEPCKDFLHASDMVQYIKASGMDFGISGACYPEGHPASASLDEDIANLKIKVDAGAEHLVSQLFFDNEIFYRFLDKTQAAGINVPIEAGIMPVINKKQIERMVSLCGASLPAKFTRMMSRYGEDKEAMRDAGIAYAIDQIVDLAAHGVDGIHLYTMNNPLVARRITEGVRTLL